MRTRRQAFTWGSANEADGTTAPPDHGQERTRLFAAEDLAEGHVMGATCGRTPQPGLRPARALLVIQPAPQQRQITRLNPRTRAAYDAGLG